MDKKSSDRGEQSVERKPWKTPELTPHPVTKLTRGTFSGIGYDFGIYS